MYLFDFFNFYFVDFFARGIIEY